MRKAAHSLELNPAKTRTILSLYSPDGTYTDEALDLVNSGHASLVPVFKEYVKKGFSIREITQILHWSVLDLELDAVLESFSDDLIKDKEGS